MNQHIPHRYAIALNILLPIAASAWLAAIAAIIARTPYPSDAMDISLLAVHVTFALTGASLAILNPRIGPFLASLPAAAGLYGIWFGPTIMWKLQLPNAVAIWCAGMAHRHLFPEDTLVTRTVRSHPIPPTNGIRIPAPPQRLPQRPTE